MHMYMYMYTCISLPSNYMFKSVNERRQSKATTPEDNSYYVYKYMFVDQHMYMCVHVQCSLHYNVHVHVYMYSRTCKFSKSPEAQILSTVALHKITACTDDASIFGFSPLNWAIV